VRMRIATEPADFWSKQTKLPELRNIFILVFSNFIDDTVVLYGLIVGQSECEAFSST
jgi:hypothetical protein